MIDTLRQALERIEKLPEDLQAEAAAEIAQLIDRLEGDAKWDAAFADPASDAFFAQLSQEADTAQQTNTLQPLIPTA